MKSNTLGVAALMIVIASGCNQQSAEQSESPRPTLDNQIQSIQNSSMSPEAKAAAMAEAEKAAARERARAAQQPATQ